MRERLTAMKQLLTRLGRASIWGPDGIGSKDERVRGLLRVALPALDVALILFGIGGASGGAPALRDVFDPIYAQAWSVAIGLAAAGCLLGLAFPRRFWRIERGGKAILSWLLLIYGGAILYAGGLTADVGRSAVGLVPIALIPILVWRILDVSKDAKRNGWPGAAR